jgi:hypothetical protein
MDKEIVSAKNKNSYELRKLEIEPSDAKMVSLAVTKILKSGKES